MPDPADQYWSPYVYCGNNPLKIVDRDGEFGVLIGLAVAYGTALSTSPDTQWDLMDIASTFTDRQSTTLDKIGSVAGALVPILGSVQTKTGLRVASEVGQKISKFFKRGDDAVKGTTEVVERVMSKAELKATKKTGLIRGGRKGTHHVSPSANKSAKRARQRLATPDKPEVRAKMEVPAGKFSEATEVKPANSMPGGGLERKATGDIPVKVLEEQEY